MIYCTCSYSTQENESVVEYLLNGEPRAKLEPIEIPGVSSREGKIEHTRRILPDDVFEGFFIAKISKLKQ